MFRWLGSYPRGRWLESNPRPHVVVVVDIQNHLLSCEYPQCKSEQPLIAVFVRLNPLSKRSFSKPTAKNTLSRLKKTCKGLEFLTIQQNKRTIFLVGKPIRTRRKEVSMAMLDFRNLCHDRLRLEKSHLR